MAKEGTEQPGEGQNLELGRVEAALRQSEASRRLSYLQDRLDDIKGTGHTQILGDSAASVRLREDLELAARLTARFSKGRDAASVTVQAGDLNGNVQTLDVAPLPAEDIPADWYL